MSDRPPRSVFRDHSRPAAVTGGRSPDPDIHATRGIELAARGDLAGAVAEFREAVRLAPDDARALTNLGTALSRWGHKSGDPAAVAEGLEHTRAAARLRPDDSQIRTNLGVALVQSARYNEAAEELRTAILLDPESQALRMGLAMVLVALERDAEALPILDEILSREPARVDARIHRGGLRLAMGDHAGAWEDLTYRLGPAAPDAPPRWDGRELSGALLLDGKAEGFGDCFQGARWIAEARRRVGSTVLLCPGSMARLMARVAGVDRIVTSPAEVGPVAARIEVLGLAGLFGEHPSGEPYLTAADPEVVAKWRATRDSTPCLKVGIAWAGDPRYINDAGRSFGLAAMAPLVKVGGVEWIALQKGDALGQIAATGFPVAMPGPAYLGGDWRTTAMVVSALDLVITPDSAIAHLAGGLGVPTWIALPWPAEWRWGRSGQTTPWYRTARLFRQSSPGGDWLEVFRRMAEELTGLVAR